MQKAAESQSSGHVIRFGEHARFPVAALDNGRLERLLNALETRFCQEDVDWLTDTDEVMAEIGRAYLGLNFETLHERLKPTVAACAYTDLVEVAR